MDEGADIDPMTGSAPGAGVLQLGAYDIMGTYGIQLELDVSTVAERDPFGYFHRSELACPIIDVLEDKAVNGSEVIRIEASFDRIGIQPNHGNQSRLKQAHHNL